MAKLIPVDIFDLIIFGGTGDLAMRKLLPALYHRDRDGQVTGDSRIVAASRGAHSRKQYLALVRQALKDNLAEGEFDDKHWKKFSSRMHRAIIASASVRRPDVNRPGPPKCWRVFFSCSTNRSGSSLPFDSG